MKKINKIEKSLTRLIWGKKKLIINIRNEGDNITIHSVDIKRIKGKYYKQLYANKVDNLEEMNKFLGRHKLPKIIQEEIDNPNSPTSIKEIESIV